jgi:succinate dehydrogenase / fumarate reductase flavoprotein subunit
MTADLITLEDVSDETQHDVQYGEVTVPVLIIGAGAAGVRTAIELTNRDIDCLVLGKRQHGDAHTIRASGGINAAFGNLDEDDDWTIHAADTLNEGHFINDPTAVETVTQAMPDHVRELDDWGCPFNRTDDGDIDQRYFGGQVYRRTCYAGDRTGDAILETLVEKAQDLDVPYQENVMITTLLSDGEHVHGAAGYDMDDGHFILYHAQHTVLAAGGCTAMYKRHSSREDENTADGPALALDAGAEFMDAEFVQFHPTGMVAPDGIDESWAGQLVTEAVRGEGGKLVNTDGDRFMEDYAPEKMELAGRDTVARAIEQEVRDGRGTDAGGVYLDISHEDSGYLEENIPRMYGRFNDLGTDMAEEPIEVAPTAHYTMGGVDIDFETGETALDGLYAAGETTAGVHGANRLGGNSLAETVAIGTVIGEHLIAQNPSEPSDLPADMTAQAEQQFAALAAMTGTDGSEAPSEIISDLSEVLWEYAGIFRDEEGLDAGLEKLAALRERATDIQIADDRTSESFEFALDLQFMLPVAEALIRAATQRTESRGGHYRTDHTDQDDDWQQNILCSYDDGELNLRVRGVDEPSEPVQQAVEEDHELEYHHLE